MEIVYQVIINKALKRERRARSELIYYLQIKDTTPKQQVPIKERDEASPVYRIKISRKDVETTNISL